MQVLILEGQILALELPQSVDMEIVETEPGIKDASASARNKPATMDTGLTIKVPEYLSLATRSASILLNAAILAGMSNLSC